MRRTIEFDNYATFRTIKIDNVATYAFLAAKLFPEELTLPEVCPQNGFSGGSGVAEFLAKCLPRSDVVGATSWWAHMRL